jgi:hypothetical protein
VSKVISESTIQWGDATRWQIYKNVRVLMKILRAIVSVFAVTVLSACGGGGSSTPSAGTPNQESTPPSLNGQEALETFGDGHGVLRVRTDASNVVAIVPNITDITGTVPATTTDTASIYTLGVDTNSWGRYYSMTANVNNVEINTSAWVDSTSQALMFYSHFQSNPAMVAAGGPPAENIPTGTHVFRGVAVFGTRSNAGRASDAGTFDMSVNFDDGITDIVANIPSNGGSSISSLVYRDIPIDLAAGTFQITSATLTIDGVSQSASIYGSFHGDGATGVSLVFHDTEETPLYAGAAAGHR